MIGLVLSNPRHHAEMMLPVACELARRGTKVRVISLAELRGFATPTWDVPVGVEVIRAVPARIRKNPSLGAGIGVSPDDRAGSLLRRTAQLALWSVLGTRLLWLLRSCRVVMIPNDAAYPYRDLIVRLRARRIPYVLLQEGIRFPLPAETTDPYGKSGADAVCAWGEGSAEHFRRIGVAANTIHITGNPRFDELAVESFRLQGADLLAKAGVTSAPLVYLSNPIDDQGFCSTEDKLALFRRFLIDASPELARRRVPLALKLHPREELEGFQRVAAETKASVVFLNDAPLFALLAGARAAVVLASTAGLEALVFGVPLGVMSLPDHGFVFEYVTHGAAIGILPHAISAGVAALLDGAASAQVHREAFIERHLATRGRATHNLASVLSGLSEGRA